MYSELWLVTFTCPLDGEGQFTVSPRWPRPNRGQHGGHWRICHCLTGTYWFFTSHLWDCWSHQGVGLFTDILRNRFAFILNPYVASVCLPTIFRGQMAYFLISSGQSVGRRQQQHENERAHWLARQSMNVPTVNRSCHDDCAESIVTHVATIVTSLIS